MARTNEMAIGIPKELYDRISEYLEIDIVKKQGMTSKRQFVIFCLRKTFEYFDNPNSQKNSEELVYTSEELHKIIDKHEMTEKTIKKLEEKFNELERRYDIVTSVPLTKPKNYEDIDIEIRKDIENNMVPRSEEIEEWIKHEKLTKKRLEAIHERLEELKDNKDEKVISMSYDLYENEDI